MISKKVLKFLQILIISFLSVKSGFCETSTYTLTNGTNEKFINVSLINGMYAVNITADNNEYRAAFRTSDNNWYEQTEDSWEPIENSNLIKNLNTKFQNMEHKNVLKCTSGHQLIVRAGYESGSIGLESLTMIHNDGDIQVQFPIHGDLIHTNKMSSNITGGTLVIIMNSFGLNDCISLQKADSLYELEEKLYPDGITDKNRNSLLDDMMAWLQEDKNNGSETRNTSTKQIFLEQLSTVLAKSINRDEKLIERAPIYMPENLYNATTSPYLTMYLTKIRENNTEFNALERPVFASQLYLAGYEYNPGEYQSITKYEGNKIAEQAIKYTKESVVSRIPLKNFSYINYSKILSNKYKGFDTVVDEIKNYNNPMPYSENGIDTPESLYYKMQLKVNNSENKNTYVFGNQKAKISGVGVDNLGFLTGCLAMSGLQSSISNLANETPAKNLYDYSKNKKTIEEDLSTFGTQTPKNSSYYTNYQFIDQNELKSLLFQYSDLAKISYIISDLDTVRKGDLIFGNDGRYKLGIITAVNKNSESTVTKDDISFVWINHQTEFAEETTWTNTDFATEASQDCFCIRRLLKKTENIETTPYTEASCDVCDCRIHSSEIEVGNLYEQNQSDITEKWRWIPNTGEYLMFENIKITVKNAAGMVIPTNENNLLKITLDGAKDRCYDKTETDSKNIYNNTVGSFDITVYTIYKNLGINYTLTNSSTEASTYKASIVQIPNLEAFTINEEGMLVNGKDLLKLGIRPSNSQVANPGDDLLLQFKARYSIEPELATSDQNLNTKPNNIIEMAESDYIAVYDKKLLWRANLYIDDGAKDWNNMHPWNVPPESGITASEKTKEWWTTDWGYNEWNRVYDFEKFSKNEFNLSSLDTGDGTQKVVPPHDSIYCYNNTNEQVTTKKVVYDWNGQDGPFVFNYKMDNQRTVLSHNPMTLNDLKFYTSLCDRGGTTEQLNHFWSYTTPPKNEHGNYMFSSNKYNLNTLSTTKGGVILNPDARKIESESLMVGDITYHPYVPALTNSITRQFVSPFTCAANISTGYTAGTDCVSFGQRSAGYEGNRYTWPDLPTRLWGASWYTGQSYPYWDGNAILIVAQNKRVEIGKDEKNKPIYYYPKLENIMPGDIIYYAKEGDDGSSVNHPGRHLMVVLENTGENTDTSLENIKIIESTNGSAYGYVQTNRSLAKIEKLDKNWFVIRLRIK